MHFKKGARTGPCVLRRRHASRHMAWAEIWTDLISTVRPPQVQCGAHYPQKQRWQRLRAQAPIVRGVCCNSSAWAIQRGASTTVVRTLSQDPWMRGTALFEQVSSYGAHQGWCGRVSGGGIHLAACVVNQSCYWGCLYFRSSRSTTEACRN